MRMQEVIMQLRELAPVAAENTSFAETLMCELVGVMEDMQNATTLTACKAIAAEAFKQCKGAQKAIVTATNAVAELQRCNAAYKEKLGPRAKKPKDDPRQMDLFRSCPDGSPVGVIPPDHPAGHPGWTEKVSTDVSPAGKETVLSIQSTRPTQEGGGL